MSVSRHLVVPPKIYSFRRSLWDRPFEVFSGAPGGGGPREGTGAPGRRVYVSQRSQKPRRLSDEARLEALFPAFGFEIVEPEELSAAENTSVFADCDFVAGPSGSGLFNILFSARPFKVLVLVPPFQKYEHEFLTLADICAAKGGSVGYIFGRTVGLPEQSRGSWYDYTWEVDLELVERTLGRLVS